MRNVGLITGASSGIGKEFARIHASKGNDVVLVARREDELIALKNELESKYKIKALVLQKDLMKSNAAYEIFDQLESDGIQVDYLFNNAGLGGYGNFHERDLDKERDMIQLNIIALTELTHLFIQGMVQRKKGKILNTASTAGMLPGPLQSVYYATKAYVVSFSQGVAHEVKNTGVTVTALCPGPVRTEFEKEAGMSNSGLFEKAASAEATAHYGYEAMLKGKLVAISDGKLKFMINWLLPFVPRKTVLSLVEKTQKID